MMVSRDQDSAEVVGSTLAQTKRGKKIILGRHKGGLYFLKFKDGGKLPKCLSGKYISVKQATFDSELYVLRMKSRKDPEINQKD